MGIAGLRICDSLGQAELMWALQGSGAVAVVALAGADPALHRRLDGALDVGQAPGPRQLLHPLPDSPGGPDWDRAAGPQLPCALAHRGPGLRRGGLNPSAPPPLCCSFASPSSPSLSTSPLILDPHYFQWGFYVVYISSQVCTEDLSSFREDKQTKV